MLTYLRCDHIIDNNRLGKYRRLQHRIGRFCHQIDTEFWVIVYFFVAENDESSSFDSCRNQAYKIFLFSMRSFHEFLHFMTYSEYSLIERYPR